jgi:putative oxygen-independent coproporphyrinogen III oxidase
VIDDVAERLAAAVPEDAYGVYIHIPFCLRKCDYCAFATWTDKAHLIEDYLDAVVMEIERAVADGMPTATSVFFGGGTPSLLSAAQLDRLLNAFPRTADAEVTAECNPDTVDEAKLAGYRRAGVNRLSFGVQSMVPHVLEALGRTHDPKNVWSAVRSARRVGFGNVNLDLIYGAAEESLEDWRITVERALDLEPEHVSPYGLTVESGTLLARDRARHPDDDDQADKYLLANELLEASGRSWYEISNFSLPGKESRHNLVYWLQLDYRGLGCAAHSHRSGRRWWNIRAPEPYIAAMRADRTPERGGETLTTRQQEVERLQLQLRSAVGVPVDAFLPDDSRAMVLHELVERRGDRAALSVKGRLLANEVAVLLHGRAHPIRDRAAQPERPDAQRARSARGQRFVGRRHEVAD